MAEHKLINISVVIPTFNREAGLRRCLTSLFSQDVPAASYEIIVVDDGSCDSTPATVSELSQARENLRYLRQERMGPASARNLAIRHCRGEVVAFIDDDCEAAPGWLKLMLELHAEHPQIAAVGGYTVPGKTALWLEVSQFLSNCSIQINISGRKKTIFFPTCNVSLKKSLFESYRFDPAFPYPAGEDLEFFWRLYKHGHRFIYEPKIRVIHHRLGGLRTFFRQAYLYGRGNLLVQRIHKDHPLLKELKTGRLSFWLNTFINLIKIPRFCLLLSKGFLNQEKRVYTFRQKAGLLFCLGAHKLAYLYGNIAEFVFRPRLNHSLRVPRLLLLDITHKCNLHCRICDIWKTGEKEKNIPGEYVKKVLLEAKELGVKEIAFSGGEPLLREDIFELIEYANKLGHKNIGLLSNGIAINRNFERLSPYFCDRTLVPVISLDSLDEKLHNYVRQDNLSWQASTKALKALSKLKERCPQVCFNVISIVLNRNLSELEDIYKFVRGLGADSIQFQPLLPNNMQMSQRKSAELWVGQDKFPELDMAISKLLAFKQRDAGFLKNSAANLSLMKKYFSGELKTGDCRCLSADKTVLLANDGKFRTCFAVYGDIHRQGLRSVLCGKKVESARKGVLACSWPCLLPCFCD